MIQALHLLCTLFQLLLYQLHFRSSGIRISRSGTPVQMLYVWVVGQGIPKRLSSPLHLIPTRVFGLLNQQKLTRGQTRNSDKAFTRAPDAAKGGRDEQQVLLLVGSLRWASLFLTQHEGRSMSRARARGVASMVCPPLRPTQIAYSKAETLLCQQRSIQSRLWFFLWSCMDVRVGL